MARGGAIKNSKLNSGYAAYTPPCPYIKAKFAGYSREKQLFIVAALGVISCRCCREVHTLEGFVDEQSN